MKEVALDRRGFAKASLIALAGLQASRVQGAGQTAAMNGSNARKGAVMPRSEADAIGALVDYCLNTKFGDLPAEVVETTKRQVLDTIGVALAGASAEGVPELREFTVEMGGKPESHIWGTTVRVPSYEAVRVNGAMAHALDYDDTHEKSYVHPSVITIPAVLAIAEMTQGVSGKDVIVATALGTDLSCRLAMAGQPGVSPLAIGWHNTTTYGYISSALVAGKLLGLNRDQMVNAAGIAYHQAAGNAQAHIDGALTKRMGPGLAGSAGVLAALLARRGLTGARDVLEGPVGLYPQYHRGNYDRSLLLDGLGREFAATELSFKPYPSCRGSHTAVDAALALLEKERFSVADIKSIAIHNGPGEYKLLGDPIAGKRRPTTVVEAQFSNPWIVATTLVNGGISLSDFAPEGISRPEVLTLTKKTRTVLDNSLLARGGGVGAARIVVELNDGSLLEETISKAKGEPSRPMTSGEFERKFADCAREAGLSADHAASLMQRILSIETIADASALPALMISSA